MAAIRYGEVFKRHVVQEMESQGISLSRTSLKYGIKGDHTVKKWAMKYGARQYGKVIRVEHPHEINELKRLKKELQKAKEALADAHMDLKLERAFLNIACKRLGEEVESFKKKADGNPRTKS